MSWASVVGGWHGVCLIAVTRGGAQVLREEAARCKASALIAASYAAPKKKMALAAQSGFLGSRGILESAISPIMAMTMPASWPMAR